MAKVTTLALALALGSAVALPAEPVVVMDKRQSSGGLSGLLGGLLGGGSKGASTGGSSNPLMSSLSSMGSFNLGAMIKELPTMGPLLSAAASNKMGVYMGDPSATESLTSLAKALGATRDSPGGLRSFTMTTTNPGYGVVPDPPGAMPRKQVMKTTSKVPNAQTIKIRYGPYSVPSMAKKNGIGEEGMLSNYPDEKMQKPCDGDCTIIGMKAGLEFANGTSANIDKGLWLHHIVLFAKGPGRQDETCAHRDVSVPHANIVATPRNSERIFASGNERSVFNLADWGVTDTGIKLRKSDEIAALIELMNENMSDQVMYFTMEYDILEGHPYKDDAKVLWFDVRNCGTSEVNPPAGQEKFTLYHNWTSTIDAEILGAIGHAHDGGTVTKMMVDGKETCENIAKYGTTPEYVQQTAMGHHANGALKHISDMKPCYGSAFADKTMKKGQMWTHRADYDFNTYKGMKHEDGTWDAVMGIEIMFVRVKGQ